VHRSVRVHVIVEMPGVPCAWLDPRWFAIATARIPNVGPTTKQRLASAGFATAADFVGGRVDKTKWPNGWTVDRSCILVRPSGAEVTIDRMGPERLESLLIWRCDVLQGAVSPPRGTAPLASPVSATVMCGSCGRMTRIVEVPGTATCTCGRQLP
jgi:hypothetical protein